MTTHEVEEMLGITKQSLIYYEKEGLIHPKKMKIIIEITCKKILIF